MMATMPILEARNLSRQVGGTKIVDDISFQVHRSEVLAVVGPSGSGKSSLLRLLNRLDEPTAGTVSLEGVDYRSIPPRELRRRVGMVTQIPYLFPGTVADNLRFGPRQQARDLQDQEVAALLAKVGLHNHADRDASQLSGGEAQRVSLARALANGPSVLLLDEPTSALDEGSKQGVEILILGVVRESALACVMVTHDRAQAERVAGRVLRLAMGKAVHLGPAKEVLDAEADLP
jgi:ABC-type iron transport system FetAB ATPase subunit